MSSPIICGACGKEIPLIRVPYINNKKKHYSILNFQSIYKSVDNLWMNSLSDRFTKRDCVILRTDERTSISNEFGYYIALGMNKAFVNADSELITFIDKNKKGRIFQKI